MKWFEDSIPDAINVSKQRGSLFIVYIYGTDEQSQRMTTSLESSEVEQFLESNGAVALKILNTSEECQFFSQIYPVVVVPSVFCIGDAGTPLEVIGGSLTEEECLKKLKDVQQFYQRFYYIILEGTEHLTFQHQLAWNTNHTARKATAAPRLVQQQSPPQQQPQQQQPQPMDTSPPDPQASSSSGDIEMTETTPTEGAAGGGDPDQALEHKVERAKELMEKVKEKKEHEAFEKQRNAEIERRKFGAEVQKLKTSQQEQQQKELKEQLRRDKEEERKARERVKAQIAKDREERAVRFRKEKEDRDKSAEESKKAKEMERQRQAAEQDALRCETARIQVRLPDGSSMSHSFPATDTFQSLRNLVSQRVGRFATISTTYPKRTFTCEDDSKTFRELQLTPSAVVMALPGTSRPSQVVSSSTSGLFTLLMSPFLWLWKFMYSMFVPLGRGGDERPSSQSSTSASSSASARDRPATARRRTGRISDLNKDDDDSATYNGNTTQQL